MQKSLCKYYSFSNQRLNDIVHVILGTLFIVFLAQVKVPLTPVPITLHTFALYTLALYTGKNRAAMSASTYLVLATIGLPVFPNLHANPLWMIGPTAGFLASFPIACYAMGYLAKATWKPTLLRIALSLIAGAFIIFFFGIAWLGTFMDWNQALAVGLYPFITIEILKICGAISLKMAGMSRYAQLTSKLGFEI